MQPMVAGQTKAMLLTAVVLGDRYARPYTDQHVATLASKGATMNSLIRYTSLIKEMTE